MRASSERFSKGSGFFGSSEDFDFGGFFVASLAARLPAEFFGAADVPVLSGFFLRPVVFLLPAALQAGFFASDAGRSAAAAFVAFSFSLAVVDRVVLLGMVTGWRLSAIAAAAAAAGGCSVCLWLLLLLFVTNGLFCQSIVALIGRAPAIWIFFVGAKS